MQKRLFLFALFLFVSLVFAESFSSSVSTYCGQYEAGQINFLQFNVLLNNEREKLFDTLNEEQGFRENEEFRERREGDEEERQEFHGWSSDKMRSLFGEPTGEEEWAWSPISRRSVRLSSPAPTWKKTLYDGRKLIVTLESHPQVIQRDGETTLFYHFDIRPTYKTEETFNTEQLVAEFTQLVQNANGDNEKLRQAAVKAVEIERNLGDYLRENPHACGETLASWFHYPGGQTSKLKWQATLYDGDRVTVKLNADESLGEWHSVNSWIETQHREEMQRVQVQNQQNLPAMYGSANEYIVKIRELIGELKRTATNFDANPSQANLRHLEELSQSYSQLVNEFNNRVGRRELELSNDEAVSEIEKIFAEQVDFTKENVNQLEFKQSLFNTTKEVQSSYCRSEEVACGETQACSDAMCVESTCQEMRCGPCQYQDRLTCVCVQANNCVPQEEPNRQYEEFPRDQNGQGQNEGAQNEQWSNQSQGGLNEQPRNQEPQQQQNESSSPQVNNETSVPVVQSQPANDSQNFSRSPLTALVVENGLENQQPPVCNPDQCNANQVCGERSWCECQQGYSDCDGDWLNGCESRNQCKQCEADSDCAPSRCSEDHGRVVSFQCKQGESFTQQTGGAEFGANCEQRNSGELNAGVWLSAWGDDFQVFDQFKQQAWSASDEKRCEAELEQAKRKRLELQASLNNEFFKWFFDNFVSTNPNEFEKQGKAIRGIYEAFQQNSDETARAMRCLGRGDWPSEYRPINAEIDTAFGKVRLWEERKHTNFWGTEQEIFSPYIKMWVFPPKEVFKRFFVEKIKKDGPIGPSPDELAEMRNSPEAMAKIRTIANAFGGDARIIIQAIDNGQPLVKFVFIVNERDLIKLGPVENYAGPVSATVSVDLDFIYDIASSVEKESQGEHIEYPYWEHGQEPKRIVDEAVVVVKVFARIFGGITNGEIKIEPASAVPKIVFILKEMMQMIMSDAAG